MDCLAELLASLSSATVATPAVTTAATLRDRWLANGIQPDDQRLRHTWAALQAQGDRPIDLDTFRQMIGPELLMVAKVLNQQLIVPEWHDFEQDIRFFFKQVAADCRGANADPIPIPRDADPERWGVAICTVDGQRLAYGDVDIDHAIQSVSKPVTDAHALAREEMDVTHPFVGVEPSGRPFNALDLLPDSRPLNPCVNVGCSFFVLQHREDGTEAIRRRRHTGQWRCLSDHGPAGAQHR